MNSDTQQSIALETAQDLIFGKCVVLPAEEVSLSASLNRFAARPLAALEALPGYDQSLRDGFAIGEQVQGGGSSFEIIDEVAAGDTRKLTLASGEAIRIMTGGLVPDGTLRVVPNELCSVNGGRVHCVSFLQTSQKSFIHHKGRELAQGKLIVESGSAIRAEQLILLAGVGYKTVSVVRKPRVSFFCTGSELVIGGDEKLSGQKFSANAHLLHGLIELSGAKLQKQRTVRDDPDTVRETIRKLLSSHCDVIISTGGMGPGKFDLVEEAFLNMGGEVVYRSLQLRPGKSTLFGLLGKTLFFGMPGPPPAVHLLFNELIRPAILALQGARFCRPKSIQARLSESLYLPLHGLPRLKSGLLSFEDGECRVRPSTRVDVSNCYIHCSTAKRELKTGEQVIVHMTGSLPCFD